MMNNRDGDGDRDINLGKGNYNENIQGNYIKKQIIKKPSLKEPFKPIKYIPKFGSKNFVGRKDELAKVHKKLYDEQNNRVAISAVSGMGGVGKTELAIQYANKYDDNYSGGICWLNARGGNLATEIIKFIQQKMGLEVPQKDPQGNALTVEDQVAWCWQNWRPPEGLVLVILDDVAEYKDVKKLLPRTDSKRFKLLITTRQRRLDTNFVDLPLDVLSEDEALLLLRGILGEEDGRIDRELQTAKDLCQWLGYLPLGLELVGRYLQDDPDLSIAQMLEELNEERLVNEAINPDSEELEATEMTAKLGVQAAFNLTWKKFESKTKEVGELLSLFDPNTIAWKYVESVSESLNWVKKDVKNAKKQLNKLYFIQSLGEKEPSYKIHPLIREFLQTKLNESEHKSDYTQSFCGKFIEISKTIPEATTLEFINSVKNAIPHLTEVAEQHLDTVSDENLYPVFMGLAGFYRGQGLYPSAEPWCQQYAEVTKSRLGEDHLDYAQSLNNLACLYSFQGRYTEAKPLHTQVLELIKRILGEDHPHYASSLNNLAYLYSSQGRYDQAEPLYTKALELTKRILGEDHPDYASSFNTNCKQQIPGKKGYPKFRKHSRSIEYKTTGWKLSENRKKITFTDKNNIGQVKLKGTRDLNWYDIKQVKRVRIVRRADGYYCQFLVDADNRAHVELTYSEIGLDVGLNHFYTDDKGNQIENPRFYRKGEKALNRLNRSKSKKYRKNNKPQSKNYHKARKRYALKHLKISRQRKDHAVKLARCVVTSNDVVAYEDLRIANMVKNHNLAKSITDAGWYQFRVWLEYFGYKFGKITIAVPPNYTSINCSSCGAKVQKALSSRTHKCKCGFVLDRDENAARNILSLGLNTAGRAVSAWGDKPSI